MHKILLYKSDEIYLDNCVADFYTEGLAYGIIIGQKTDSENYIVVHLAKNLEEDIDVYDPTDKQSLSSFVVVSASGALKSFEDIDTQSLTNQWLSATKMLPGSFVVIGIFASTNEFKILEEEAFVVANQVLYEICNLLRKSHWFHENSRLDNEFIFLAYSSKAKEAKGKCYKYTSYGSTYIPMACVFMSDPFEWYTFKCAYELNEVFPIVANTQKINIEQQFSRAIEAVRHMLDESQITISQGHNENIDDDLPIMEYLKQNFSESELQQDQDFQTLNISIFLPIKCQCNNETHAVKVRRFSGTIRFIGTISSKIYCRPHNTIADMKRYVRCDIVRSLTARIQMYCDGLTNTNISYEAVLVSEPPRRVYFNLVGRGKGASPIQFSGYIFRNEITAMAATQAKQVLDLDLDFANIHDDLEALHEEENFSTFSTDTVSLNSPSLIEASRDLNRTMYLLGITVSLLVLLLSACMHYFFRV